MDFRVLIRELHSTYIFDRQAKRVLKTNTHFELDEDQAALFPEYDQKNTLPNL